MQNNINTRYRRYEKNFALDGITVEAQEKLSLAKVVVIGAGGLGSGVIMNLVALGVGQIKIVDCGILEENNLNRQIIHKYKNIGRAKVISAKDWIQEYNTDIKVELAKIEINEINYFNVVYDYDIIIDCANTLEVNYMLNDIALRHNKILIHGSSYGFSGHITTIYPTKTGCLSCVLPQQNNFKQEKFASLSPIVNTVASIQASEALKVITGIGEPLFNKLIIFDGLKSEFKTMTYSKNLTCPTCTNSSIQRFKL